ncbi:uncharacterized protein [Misgurnus anguillicaudatus]|uniref:uncharacterized protein n=1 Tax=Misgurnus anguillicaudatus TaxID=75329 RepID=UPI003CCFB765
MFGQEPRLPVDFLLGRVTDPVAGVVHRWVEEHQAQLQVAFEGARGRLQAAASRRKTAYDQRVRELPLSEGQLVYLREHGIRGRRKIQDIWSSIEYQVVRAPEAEGAVYAVAPVGDLSKVRHVHRSLLKPRIQKEGVVDDVPTSVEFPVQEVSEGVEEVDEGDVAFVVAGAPSGGTVGHPPSLVVTRANPPTIDPVVGVSEEIRGENVGQASVSHPDSSESSDLAPRRTRHVGAGQHSNMYHLPRPVGGGVGSEDSIAESNAVLVLFRPWD